MNQKDIDRFWEKVNSSGDVSTCWLWLSAKDNTGYGVFNLDGKKVYAHRIAYELIKGKIPDGLELDHLCRNRICCNPNHLEPVTHRINCLRGIGASAKNAKVTHCPRGHPYDLENTYFPRRGGRMCRICKRRIRKESANRNHKV